MANMKTVSLFAKDGAGNVRFMTAGYETGVPGVEGDGNVLRHLTYDAEFFDMADINTIGFDPGGIRMLSGWKQTTQAIFDKAQSDRLKAQADAKAAADTASAAIVAREKEKKQAVVDALLSLGTDNPALARLAQLYS